MIGQCVRARTFDVFVLKTPNPIQLRLVQPVQQHLKFFFGFAGIADDEGRTDRHVGAGVAPGGDFGERAFGSRRACHTAQRIRVSMLKGHIQIRQDQPVGHKRHQIAYMGVGIDIVHPNPSAQTSQIVGQIQNGEFAVAVFPVGAIGRGVLADHQQFFHAVFDQLFRLAHDGPNRTRRQFAAHVGDDAELAGVVAALGDLQIAVMPGRQLHALGRQKIDKRVGVGRNGGVDRIQNLFVLVRACHRQNPGVCAGDVLRLGPQTACHDHPPIFVQRLANGLKTFGLGAVQKSASVHDDGICAAVFGADRIAFGAKARQDPFTVHQSLRTAKRDHPDGRLIVTSVITSIVWHFGRSQIGAKIGWIAHDRLDTGNDRQRPAMA